MINNKKFFFRAFIGADGKGNIVGVGHMPYALSREFPKRFVSDYEFNRALRGLRQIGYRVQQL